MKKLTLPISIIVILVVGYLVFFARPADNQNDTVVQPSSSSSPTADTIDTSTWKTYRNERYGFEVKYPADYIVRAQGDRIRILSPRDIEILNHPEYTDKPVGFSIATFESNSTISLEKWIQEYYNLPSLTVLPFNQRNLGTKGALINLIESAEIGSDYSSYLIHDGAGVVEGIYTYYVKRDKTVIGIETYYQRDLSGDIFKGILASFRFI